MVSELTGVYKEHNFVHEIDRYQKQTLLSISFLFFFAKKKRKYASQSRGGCWKSKNGEGLIRLGVIYLKVVHVGLLAIPRCQDCLREQHKRLPQVMKS
ncbi:unnamed protein product [Porites lobata]|uniref:Uncharacterized protein n=1 Tax=Porites lobata TaxID=104759 RepID=A0ABN8SE39_9CNID|nr:unnamed protein product [Porites lobata]